MRCSGRGRASRSLAADLSVRRLFEERHVQRTDALAKLKALFAGLSDRLKDARALYFDPPLALEFFERYAPLRDFLRAELPSLLDDLAIRPAPTSSGTTDFEGRGYITRQPLDLLRRDMQYIFDVLSATPTVDVPSMKVTREGVFFAGQYFDALMQVAELVANASNSLVLIDGYIGPETLGLLAGKKGGTVAQILTKACPSSVKVLAEAFHKQHGSLEIRLSQAFHDRFLLIDDKEFYHFGASIKDLGRRGFMFSAIEEPAVAACVRQQFQQEWATATVVL